MSDEKVINVVICAYYLAIDNIIEKMEFVGKDLGIKFYGVVINNAELIDDLDYKSTFLNLHIKSGSNLILDFSGYYEGLESLRKRNENFQKVLLLNDSLFTDHPWRYGMRKISNYYFALDKMGPDPVIVGRLDRYITSCLSNPWSGSYGYISSYMFLMNVEAADIFAKEYRRFLYNYTNDIILYSQKFVEDAPVQMKAQIRYQLSMQGFPGAWHKLDSPKIDDALLSKKSLTIYFEHFNTGMVGLKGSVISLYPRFRDTAKYFCYEKFFRLIKIVKSVFLRNV